MFILGIESSCDETAVAIINEQGQIYSHLVRSQVKEHLNYGGVVPEIAARSHINYIDKLLNEAISSSSLNLNSINAIGATSGPGLIGGVIVGCMIAKAMSMILNKPFIAVNHLEAHLLVPRISSELKFPFLTLLVSGGHTLLVYAKSLGQYQLLGSSIDDAVGEAFDKVAKLLDLDYPGGPQIEKLARAGDNSRFKFPKPLCSEGNLNFSLSGLKTAVLRETEKLQTLSAKDKEDISASFQLTVASIICYKIEQAFIFAENNHLLFNDFVLTGGVAANNYIRSQVEDLCMKYGKNFISPPLNLCTDNGVMVAWAAMEKFKAGIRDGLDFSPRSKWPL